MDPEFKEGDEVYYKQHAQEPDRQKRYKILRVEQIQVPPDVKIFSNEQQNKSLYGKEIDKVSQPRLRFVIEPLNGGSPITVKQGELESVQHK